MAEAKLNIKIGQALKIQMGDCKSNLGNIGSDHHILDHALDLLRQQRGAKATTSKVQVPLWKQFWKHNISWLSMIW